MRLKYWNGPDDWEEEEPKVCCYCPGCGKALVYGEDIYRQNDSIIGCESCISRGEVNENDDIFEEDEEEY